MSAVTGICTGSLRVDKSFFASTFHQEETHKGIETPFKAFANRADPDQPSLVKDV